MRLVRLFVISLVLVLAAIGGASAQASHQTDKGWVHTGVGSEDEARAYPCPTAEAGGWERTGPVVCFEKRTAQWKLDYDAPGTGCSYYPGGWRGSCIFDLDMGDHVKVWGTRGIPYTPFQLTWLHDSQAAAPADGESPGASPSGGSNSAFEPPAAPDAASLRRAAGASGAAKAPDGDAPTVPQTEGDDATEVPRLEPSSVAAQDTSTRAHGPDEPDHGHQADASRGGSAWLVLVLGAVAAGGGGALWLRRRRTSEVTRSSPDGDPLA